MICYILWQNPEIPSYTSVLADGFSLTTERYPPLGSYFLLLNGTWDICRNPLFATFAALYSLASDQLLLLTVRYSLQPLKILIARRTLHDVCSMLLLFLL